MHKKYIVIKNAFFYKSLISYSVKIILNSYLKFYFLEWKNRQNSTSVISTQFSK
jgi:hypothetical protein